ncbi:hypothetical protein [Micromonospora sp. HK10]|uniref:hypothetical protein n=1 Tax=Micromonospora sp. HK10 TaxID=1538294 RepID=UPI0012E0F63A|nr:hypothetical protein [Micromonospora sp. HK10]
MADLDFFVDVVVSGALLGVGLADSPDDVARALGSDLAEGCDRVAMRRDYGLVEFYWARRDRSHPWHASSFTVQVHRLASIDVTGALVQRYGPFGRQLRFARLNAELERLGYQLEKITQEADAGYRLYWLAESRMSLAVATTPHGELIDAGDVWSISAPHLPETVSAAGLGEQRQAIKDGLTHLLRLGHSQRRDWLDRRQPAPRERVNWWLHLLLVIDQQLRHQPSRRPDWVALKLWLLHQGQALGCLHRSRERREDGVLRNRHAARGCRVAGAAADRRQRRPGLP